MWEKIKLFLVGFATAFVAFICFIFGRRSKDMVHETGSGTNGEGLGDSSERIATAEEAVSDGLSILRKGKERAEKETN